ncbi:MAG: type II toxin-antitoxin system Phd/YefM family antitoxin [bacterium]|nr:type II toxin-antitoxin system Phd/YefM family antitoxin [bacterium]
MRLSEDVKPVDELLTSGAKLVRSVAENRGTILLTDKGAAKAVLMDVASYDKWRDTVAMLQLIAQSEADLEVGRTVSQDEAFTRAEHTIAEVEQAD